MRQSRTTEQTKRRHLARTTLATLLAATLCAAPLAAFGDSDEAATASGSAAAAGASGVTAGDAQNASDASAASAIQHGLLATAGQTVNSNEAILEVTGDGACGLYAEKDATIVANGSNIQTKGSHGYAAATSPGGGAISLANAHLVTSGANASLLFSAGTVEADNVEGAAAHASLARIAEQGRLMIANSTLTSTYEGNAKDELPANAFALYGTADAGQASTPGDPALLQVSNSKLESSITTGSFFYLTNTSASIVLSGNVIGFDEKAAKLLVAKGTDIASNLITTDNATDDFGTAGKNGATATLSAIKQDLEGDIEVDSISSLGFYLLDDSMWTGAADITANASGTDLANNLVVNIDASSGWIVTEDSTVSTLNIEKGGKLVDENDKAVTIVDADGNKLVDGASDVKVAVTDEFSTTVKTTSANILQNATIDRSAFDEEFGTETAFGTNGTGVTPADEARAAELKDYIVAWFANL